jgi:hypothetical protein
VKLVWNQLKASDAAESLARETNRRHPPLRKEPIRGTLGEELGAKGDARSLKE